MQAVILAAGLGSRIREFHDLPKGFICIGEDPIILESIHKLKQQNINDILIVTGYRSNFYENLAKETVGVSTIHNSKYDCSGSLYSLYCAKDWIKEDFLLLESDLLYEARALQALYDAHQSTAILLSGMTNSDDEVYVQANQDQLVNMSKRIETLDQNSIAGEFVGVNKLSLLDYQHLVAVLEKDSALLMSGHYEEQGLVTLAKERSVYCLKISDLLWCEIDNLFHLQRAKEIYKNLS